MRLQELDFLTEKDRAVLIEAKREMQLRENYEKLTNVGIAFVPWFAPSYPVKLKEIDTSPYAIYVKGSLPKAHVLSAAIVGARRCTPYGEQMALRYGEELARMGVQIISGMARGIDGAGQRGALNAGGTTYGILGCGVDVCYPREHIGLYMDIQKAGGVIAELPPGTPPLPAHFPARNRLISAFSDIILIMEAGERSGSLITADQALGQGKDVFALPGPVTSPLSEGCHRLIAQGAGILISPEDLAETLSIQYVKFKQKSDKNKKILDTTENIVYSCLDLIPKSMQRLLDETGLEPKILMEQLVTLELQGVVKEISKNYYIKCGS